VAHSSGGEFGCHMGESSWLFKWPAQMVDIFSVILVNPVGYLNGQLKW
jgi:hypothetical protein